MQTGTGVSKIGPASIELSTGATVKTHTTVWAAGLQANPIVSSLGWNWCMVAAFRSAPTFR